MLNAQVQLEQNTDPITPGSGLSLTLRPSSGPALCTHPASDRRRGSARGMSRPAEGCGEEQRLPVRPAAVPVPLEQILRTLKGYDSYNTLLLPPRIPGEKLPTEMYEYFNEMKQSKEEQLKVKYLEALVQDNGENSSEGPSSCHCPGFLELSLVPSRCGAPYAFYF